MKEVLDRWVAAKIEEHAAGNAAREEFLKLPMRDRIYMVLTEDCSFLSHEGDGGFLYGTFPGGGWGKLIDQERHTTFEIYNVLENMGYDLCYNEAERRYEDNWESVVASHAAESEDDMAKLVRAFMDEAVQSMVFDW